MLYVGVACVAAVLALRAAQTFRSERSSFFPRRGPVPLPLDSGVPGLRAVRFAGAGGTWLGGWWASGTNGAALVFGHGSGSDRRNLLPEARLLAAAGYGVLLFDFPGHGESDGRVAWGISERAAYAGALGFLQTQPEVEPARLGGVGFSMGAYVLTQVAAADSRLRAVALLGPMSDAVEQTLFESRRWGPLTQGPALLALRLSPFDPRDQRPIDVVANIAPRAVLLVAGRRDTIVPPAMARALFAAAGNPKELYELPEAGHGGYLAADPAGYPQRLRSFFDRHLLRGSAAAIAR